MRLLPRLLAGPVERALRDFPVVAVLGARQTGKTTLAREIARRRGMASVTLDDPRTLEAATRDPDGFLAGTPRPLLIDEAQRAPDLFRAMKLVVDDARRPGPFLLTGSANYVLMQSVSESLAGRVALFDLHPLAWPEWLGIGEPVVLDGLLRARSVAQAMRMVSGRTGPPEAALRERIVRGGLPVPGAMRATEARASWFSAYVQTYLERDLRDLARVASLPDFYRLLRLAALRTDRILSYADLARDADLSPDDRAWLTEPGGGGVLRPSPVAVPAGPDEASRQVPEGDAPRLGSRGAPRRCDHVGRRRARRPRRAVSNDRAAGGALPGLGLGAIDDITMAQLIVRNLDEDVVRRLRARAARHGRSAEAEHRDILRRTLGGRAPDRTLGELILAIPNVGSDADFRRKREMPRRVRL